MTFHPDSLPDLTGRVYIVTGGTSGIGYNTVARLAQHGAHVYLCARSQEKGQKAVNSITELYPKAHITILEMDHVSLPTVVAAAKLFLTKETALHGLVNNAGIMSTPFEMTSDGYEAQWQTNYIAHWVFTSHLLPLMLNTSKGLPPGTVRIVNLSSSGHFSAPKGGIKFENMSLEKDSGMARYGQSKLANILHAKTLHKRYGPGSPSSKAGEGEVWTAIVHPGLVESQLGVKADFSPMLWKVFLVARAMGAQIDADKGSWTSVFCVASPEMKETQSGTYFQRIAEAGWQSCTAKDESLAERLEEWAQKEMGERGWVGS
ncbi:hypothetical protein FZEAL_8333 [Fusarium zealandicum]|uniref:NAD(P)-binding protein n=1 Tax=Fusarium zealandicum TaxID=1053134 RepID=A0A8H4UET3_9HYPO|nr:hypothetical protein FZEAL_8333 [Fusarium zealandicum]